MMSEVAEATAKAAASAHSISRMMSEVAEATAKAAASAHPPPLPTVTQKAKRRKGEGRRLNDSERLTIISVIESDNPPSLRGIARQFDVGEKTIRNIKQKKEEIKARATNESNPDTLNMKRHVGPKFPKLEEELHAWVIKNKVNTTNVNSNSTQVMIVKANEIARSLDISVDKFTATTAWIRRFKKRKGIDENVEIKIKKEDADYQTNNSEKNLPKMENEAKEISIEQNSNYNLNIGESSSDDKYNDMIAITNLLQRSLSYHIDLEKLKSQGNIPKDELEKCLTAYSNFHQELQNLSTQYYLSTKSDDKEKVQDEIDRNYSIEKVAALQNLTTPFFLVELSKNDNKEKVQCEIDEKNETSDAAVESQNVGALSTKTNHKEKVLDEIDNNNKPIDKEAELQNLSTQFCSSLSAKIEVKKEVQDEIDVNKLISNTSEDNSSIIKAEV